MSQFWHYWYMVFKWLDGLTTREWFVVLLFVVAWGVFCMRGFGSRKHH